MANQSVEAKFKVILDGINRVLAPQGFRKRGASWRLLTEGNVGLFEVQRSQTSTSDSIRFTANVGVVSARLLKDETDRDVSRATSAYAHLRERLGAFLPEREDRWWTLDEHTEPTTLLAELGPVVMRAAAFIHEHASDTQLANLWRTGRSPGLTEGQRQRLLKALTAS